MRLTFVLPILALGLAGCTPTVPDSGAQGVGFQDYSSYLNQQSRATAVPAPLIPPPGTGFSPAGVAAALDRADGRLTAGAAPVPFDAGDPNRPRGNAPAGIQIQTGEMQQGSAGISDEQDFGAVSQRESIESDRARIERNRAQYVVVQPGALPERPGDTGPNIVAYALATTHAPGNQMHRRSSFRVTDPAAACARFGSPDFAQKAFLERGGPERDRLGLDPDGDGFACTWDPRPFRAAGN